DGGLEPRPGRDGQFKAGTEPRARPADPSCTLERHVTRHAKPAAKKIDLEFAGVQWHARPIGGNMHATLGSAFCHSRYATRLQKRGAARRHGSRTRESFSPRWGNFHEGSLQRHPPPPDLPRTASSCGGTITAVSPAGGSTHETLHDPRRTSRPSGDRSCGSARSDGPGP